MADKYEHNLSSDEIYLAKQSALITVEELLDTEIGYTVKGFDYWSKVKTEIELL